MIKKPLIMVGICAIAVLVLSSLSTVVGYQAVERKERNIVDDQSGDPLINRVESVVKNGDGLRHPFLFLSVWLYLQFYLFRGWILYELSISEGAYNWVQIEYPVLFLRACSLILVGEFWLMFWQRVSSALGWNWSLDCAPWNKITR